VRRLFVDVDTVGRSPQDRFEHWLDAIQKNLVPLEISSSAITNFAASMRCVDLGVVRVATHRYPPLTARRTAKLIRESDPDVYQLLLNVRGRASVAQNRGTTSIAINDFTLLDCSRPFRASHSVESPGRPESMSIMVPRTFLRFPSYHLARLTGTRLSGRDGIGAVLRHHLYELTGNPDQYQPSEATGLGTVTLDLLLATLAHHIERDEPAAARDESVLAQAHAFIDQHLSESTLSPELVATANHVSMRTLYRLFGAEGTTVAGWIRARRLERCRRDLADSRHDGHPIHAIAAHWGFSNSAHFSRAFRAEYGMCPHGFREQQRGRRQASSTEWHASATTHGDPG
jgi:AraC-like DNA-binding protein